ncbi:MAG: hypothetical protein DRQ24_12615 [Candidatus Latescibacterota bacterium]|nr:MAG: hypothetical protein DRQ24_12615 [Candidatus Latescibacterota bacterium]
MRVSGYTLEEMAKKMEKIMDSQEFSKLEEVVEELRKLARKYSDDKELEIYQKRIKEICKEKNIKKLGELIIEIKNEAHWRQVGSASGTSLPYKDYRRLEKL